MIRWMGDDDDWPESEQCWAWWCHRFQSGYKSQLRRETAIRQRWCDTMPSPLYRNEWWAMGDADYAQQQQQNKKTAERKRNKRMHMRLIGCETVKCCLCAQTLTKRTSQTLWTMEPTQPINPLRKRKKPNPMTTYVKICQCTAGTNIQSIQQQSMNWLCIWNLDVRRIVAYQSAREESIDGGRSGHHPGHVTNHNAAQHLSMVQCQSINGNKSIKR